jgi:DNA-binding response OmpR family regulator
MSNTLKVLIAEDDLIIADILQEGLVLNGFEVVGIAATVRDGLRLAADHQPDLAVIDVRLANNDLGSDLAVELKHRSHIGVIYATSSIGLIQNCPFGQAYVAKPYRLDVICHALKVLGNYMRTGILAPFPPSVTRLTLA